jgi:sugar lactone lactonase YvrE
VSDVSTQEAVVPRGPQASTSEEPRGGRRLLLTPLRTFKIIAVVLFLILVGLLIYLLLFLGRPDDLSALTPRQGIQPVWQVYGPGEGSAPFFDRPMGVAVGRDRRIYVADAGNSRVCVFDSQGRYLFTFGSFGVAKPAPGGVATYEPGSLNYPVGIDTDDEGNVYVASLYNDSIEVFDADGTPLRRFPDPLEVTGKGGSGEGGRGIAVTDVAVSGERIYATDAYQVLVFSLDGELLDQWGRPGSDEIGLDRPNGLAVSADGGRVYVSDSNNSRVTAFTSTGEVVWQVGEPSRGVGDREPREIDLPRGLAVMSDGSVLVADAFAFELVRISSRGEIVARYGERGVEPGQLNFANDVEVLRGFVVIADRGVGRIQMVRLID